MSETQVQNPHAAALGALADQYHLQPAQLSRTWEGVAAAIKFDGEWKQQINNFFTHQPLPTNGTEPTPCEDLRPVREWLTLAQKHADEPELVLLLNLTIAIAYLRERGSSTDLTSDPVSLSFAWPIVRDTLLHSPSSFTVSRGAIGFLYVPLCSLVKDGAIEELWRLHVWMPDGERTEPSFGPHSHNCFGQSYILAGEGTDRRWAVAATADRDAADYAEYGLAWDDGGGPGGGYKTHQKSSTVTNTGRYFTVRHLKTSHEKRDMTYSITEEEWHSSHVAPDAFFATLFCFDSRRGYNAVAPILGPKDGTSFTKEKGDTGVEPEQLAGAVDSVRRWEILTEQGAQHRDVGEMDLATSAWDEALELCRKTPGFPNREVYMAATLKGKPVRPL